MKPRGLCGLIVPWMLIATVTACIHAQSTYIGEQKALALRYNTVRVDGAGSGFGIIVGEVDGSLLIVTADHVARGASYAGRWFTVGVEPEDLRGLDTGGVSPRLVRVIEAAGGLSLTAGAAVTRDSHGWIITDEDRTHRVTRTSQRILTIAPDAGPDETDVVQPLLQIEYGVAVRESFETRSKELLEDLDVHFRRTRIAGPSPEATLAGDPSSGRLTMEDRGRRLDIWVENGRLNLDVDAVAVHFFGYPDEHVSGELLHYRSPPNLALDITVVAVHIRDVPAEMRWSRFATGSVSRVSRGTAVWFVGLDKDWHVPTEPGHVVDVETRKTLVDGISVEPGSSGGPLIAESGMVGLLVVDQTGTTATAVRLDVIRGLTENWGLPWNLKQSLRLSLGITGSTIQHWFLPNFGYGLKVHGLLYGGFFAEVRTEIGRTQIGGRVDMQSFLAGAGVLLAPGGSLRLEIGGRFPFSVIAVSRWYLPTGMMERRSFVVTVGPAAKLDLIKALSTQVSGGLGVGFGDIAKSETGSPVVPFAHVEVAIEFDFVPLVGDLAAATRERRLRAGRDD